MDNERCGLRSSPTEVELENPYFNDSLVQNQLSPGLVRLISSSEGQERRWSTNIISIKEILDMMAHALGVFRGCGCGCGCGWSLSAILRRGNTLTSTTLTVHGVVLLRPNFTSAACPETLGGTSPTRRRHRRRIMT